MILDNWQKSILNTDGNIVLCTGRQVGKTTIMAIKAAEYMRSKAGSKIIIVSLTEDQAKLIIVMILDYLEKNYRALIHRGKYKPTQNKIMLKNGSTALARPVGNTGDAVRGFTGDVLIIDEASRMPDLVWAAGRPTLLTTAGHIWMCSTPFGKQGYFWEAFQNKAKRYTVFHISSEDVMRERPISTFWTEKKHTEAVAFLEGERKDMTELQYGQEYLGLFLDDLRRFFEDSLIEECCILKRRETIGEGTYFLGCDIARLGEDQSTFEIIERRGEKYYNRENITTTKQLTTDTERRIREISKLWKVKKVGIDAGAGTLGVAILDHLRETELRNKVIPLNNRAISLDEDGKKKQRLLKEDLYNNLKSMMEHGELLLLSDEDLKTSLRSVQYEYAGSKEYLSTFRIFGNFTHIVEGLNRAAWCAKQSKTLNLFATYSSDVKTRY